jgi:hypothetical protein
MARGGIDAVLRDNGFLHIVLVGGIPGLVTDADGVAIYQQIIPQIGVAAEIDTIGGP